MHPTVLQWSSENPADIFSVINPATGELISLIQGSGETEVDRAVHAAHAGFQNDWRWRTGAERGLLLLEIARRITAQADEIAEIETRENGKPISQAHRDVAACIGLFDYFGGLAGKMPGEFFDTGMVYGGTVLEPYGVVGAILPFNWPPIHTAGKVAPALAVGNAIVVKPPEQTPLTVMRILDIVRDVVPEGVVQIVAGHGPIAGAALAAHPLISKLSFTGATGTGAAVVKLAAGNSTPTLLELGGKNAVIGMADADIDLLVSWAVEAGYFNQGEACTAGSRLLLHRSIHDEVVEKLSVAVRQLKVGDGMETSTHVGPMINRRHYERVAQYLAIGQAEGARVAAQAPLPGDPALAAGHFIAPTLFTDVMPNMRIAREEIFGPVVSVLRFDDEKEAIEIANGTDFGLTAAIFSSDQAAAMRIARKIDVGIVYINHYFRSAAGMPFGGTKASGYGREHTLATLKEYGRIKLISMPSGLREMPRWQAIAEIGL